MTNTRGRAGSSYANEAVALPAIPTVRVSDPALQRFVDAVREWVEVRSGSRGDKFERAITARDLVHMGVLDSDQYVSGGYRYSAQGGAVSATPGDGSTVAVQTPSGLARMDLDAFAKMILDTKLFRSMSARLNDPGRYAELPPQVQAVLNRSILTEAQARGADVRRLEEKLQTATESLAIAVQEVTASVGTSVAGVRETAFSAATESRATAGVVTQVSAAIGDPTTFTGAGITLEESMFGTASLDGLYGEKTIKIDANGYVAGYGLAVGATTANPFDSAFLIAANKFAIVSPSGDAAITDPLNPPASRVPFGVDTTNNCIYINGNVRINAGGTPLSGLTTTDVWIATSIPDHIIRKKDGTYSPNSIIFYSYKQSGAAAPVLTASYWSRWRGTGSTSYTWTNRVDGNSTMDSGLTDLGLILSSTNTALKFELYSDAARTVLLDSMTVPIIDEGTNGLTAILSNSSHNVPCASDGTSVNYTGSGTRVYVYEGATALDYDGFGTSSGKFAITTVATGITTVGTITDGGTYANVGDHSGMTADVATITYTVAGKTSAGASFSIPQTQTITKSKQGAQGSTGGTGPTGSRGTRTLYYTNAAYTNAYNDGSGVGAPSYKNQATLKIAAETAGQTPTTPIKGDTVTFTNGTNYITTYTHDGTAWNLPGVVIDGSLLVTGSVAASALVANSLTAANITSGTTAYNGISFALGSTAQIAGLQAAMAVQSSTSGRFAALFANTTNQTGAGGIAAGVVNGSSYAGTFVNASDDTFSAFRTYVALALNQQCAQFTNYNNSYGNGTTGVKDSEVLLCDNSVAVWVKAGSFRIDQTPTAGGGNALTATSLPSGTAAGALQWVRMNFNGTDYWVPCIPV